MDQLSITFSIQTLEEIVRNCQRNEQRLHELKRHTRNERKQAERLLREKYRIKQEQLTFENKMNKSKQQPIEFFISFNDNKIHRENKIQRVRFNIPQTKKSIVDNELDNLVHRCENLLRHLNQTNDYQSLTLQQALETYRPDFISHSQQRLQHINDLREDREHQQIIPISNSNPPSPPPSRTLTAYQQMKQIAKKKYEQLPEVNQRLHEDLMNEIKQRNYIRAKIFRIRLRQHVLSHGRTNIDESLTMIDT